MGDIINLRGIVLSKYKSISEFSRTVNWSQSKASRILSGKQVPSVDEVQLLTELLHIDSVEIFMQIFFSNMSTKWTSKIA